MASKIKKIKMEPRFLNANDIQLRIDGGIVLHNGMPKHAYQTFPNDSDSDDNTFIKVFTVGTDDEGEVVNANDPSVYTKSLELGYVNTRRIHAYEGDDISKPVYKRQACFLYRGTNRKQKSVIHGTNVYCIWVGNTSVHQVGGDTWSSGGMRDMLLDEYPKSRDFSDLEPKESIAISRNFAIGGWVNELRLFFNGHEIGRRKRDENYFQLDPGFDHSIMVMRLADLAIPV